MEETRDSSPSSKDFISGLPDCLLHNILSFLDMKLAVQTSILSTRWRYIWTSLPIITVKCNLSDPYEVRFANLDEFMGFEDKVFMLPDDSAIRRLHLVWYRKIHEINREIHSRLNTWLMGCLRWNVQEISLCMQYDLFAEVKFP